jgi:splicing factor 1
MRQVNALDERHLCLVRDESIDGRHVTRIARSFRVSQRKKKKKKKKKKIMKLLSKSLSITSSFIIIICFIGVPKFIDPHALTLAQMDALGSRLRIEEITHKLVNDQLELGIDPVRGRSPSPEPTYDPATGKRTNTRDLRNREKLQIERQHLVLEAQFLCPTFRPPPDYRPVSLKKIRKLYIPVDKYPDYNFIGLIIGPRGKTHREMESETGCKIAIRGKGSARGGRPDSHADADEPLHVQISGDTEKQVLAAVRRVSALLVPTDDEKNEHKKKQLRELALINGTLRDATWAPDGAAGVETERSWVAPKIKCEHCGETSHPSSDCPFKGTDIELEYKKQKAEIDQEYLSFLDEVGLEGPPAKRANTNKDQANADYASFMADIGQ